MSYLLLHLFGEIQVLNGATRVEAMDTDLKVITDVLGNDETVIELQSLLAAFKELPWKLLWTLVHTAKEQNVDDQGGATK